MPDLAKEAGAKIVATGRSDFPNQINNVLAFPGIFRGALDVRSREINESMKLAATDALADAVGDDRLSADCILPKAFEPGIARKVAIAVARASLETGSAKLKISPNDIEETVDRGFRRIG
jgi:malate dehydrogenase (oxaloacetate-decarboxylating)